FSYCFLGSSCTSDIMQTPRQECLVGEDCDLTCNHQFFTISYYTHWYKMIPGQELVYLISDYKSTDLHENRFKVTFSNNRSFSVLNIQRVNLGDSAEYFCA
ncbi:hypothetical protein GDO78_017518, partial [Eleutherodactylus coqui]